MSKLSRYSSSSESQDILNKKHFASFISNQDNLTFSTGKLGGIPELYPELLRKLRNTLSNQDLELNPGIAVILRQLTSNTSPVAFLTFGNQLDRGFMTIGSFSPRKKTHWIEIKRLLRLLGDEVDELLEDFQKNLTKENWSNYKYDATTRIVSEQAEIVNTALRMHSTLEYGVSQRYKCKKTFLGEVTLDFTNSPLKMALEFPKSGIDNEYQDLIKLLFNTSLKPIEHLNNESIPLEDIDQVDTYISRFFSLLGEGKTISEIQDLINAVSQKDTYQTNLFKDLVKRYYGVIFTPIILNGYFDKLKFVIKEGTALTSTFDENLLDRYAKYLEMIWQRKFYLGLVILNTDYQKLILESVYQELDAFAIKIKMESVQKNAINNAIIQLDTKLSEKVINLEFPSFLIDVLLTDFYNYTIGDLIEPVIMKEAKSSAIEINDLVGEFLKILKTKIPKEEKRLLTFKDFKQTLSKIPVIVQESFTQLESSLEDFYLSKLHSDFNELYIKCASSMRFDGWMKEHNVKSPNKFSEVISDILIKNDFLEALEKLPKIDLTSENLYLNHLVKINFMNKHIENVKSILKNIKEKVKINFEKEEINFRWEYLANNLRNYILFWFKDFSGVIPEEIIVRLTNGVILLNIEVFNHLRFYVAFLEHDSKPESMDIGKYRELGMLSIEQGNIITELRDRVTRQEDNK